MTQSSFNVFYNLVSNFCGIHYLYIGYQINMILLNNGKWKNKDFIFIFLELTSKTDYLKLLNIFSSNKHYCLLLY